MIFISNHKDGRFYQPLHCILQCASILDFKGNLRDYFVAQNRSTVIPILMKIFFSLQHETTKCMRNSITVLKHCH